jgi:hypothetical protein
VFENGVLSRIFGPKVDLVPGGWRKLHNEELHNLYYSTNISRMINSRITRAACKGEMRNVCKDFGWKA